MAGILTQKGRFGEAYAVLEAATGRFPGNAMLNLRLLLQKILAQQATEGDFAAASQRLTRQVFDAHAILVMRMIVDHAVKPETPLFYKDGALGLFDALESNPAFSRFSGYENESALLKGRLYLAKSAPAEACRQYQKAIPLYNDIDLALEMVAEIATAKDLGCALSLLALAEKALERQKDRSLPRSRASYTADIKRIREIIEQEMRE
jgi:tetratricopeptide (TPR) repeat protein